MSNNVAKKLFNRILRKRRIRARVSGTAERPRLNVFVSNRHVSAQIIDDSTNTTLVASSTVKAKTDGTLTEKAAWVGTDIAKKAKKAKITHVVFDRGGRKYHGRVAALADAARKEGLEF
ncbi:MAG TPA: 50S ribosomal protein L18 [Candidatus Saccharimonadales bacterium]|nr:50S ribosomal protein L18 [Candidatus Saccharimonadales bacterium]